MTFVVSDQDKIFPLETRTAGYGLFNVAGSYTVGGEHYAHIFTIIAYNLTDKLYRNHLSLVKELTPEIGRGVRFGYTFRFFWREYFKDKETPLILGGVSFLMRVANIFSTDNHLCHIFRRR